MNKYLFLIVPVLVLMLWIGAGDMTPYSVVVFEGDVITGVSLPDWGTVCTPAEVRGGPSEDYPVLYSVGVGERVRIHDQSRPNGDWVSIKAARWIPLAALCK